MKTVKLLAVTLFAGALAMTSCKKKDDTPTTTPTNTTPGNKEVEVNSSISSNMTWQTGYTYILRGRIIVKDGATLTIEPGVVVKGQAGLGSNASCLLVARGGKLMAEGTADKPIIFTAEADAIQPGEIVSPNLDPTINGLWGGVILCGKAHISASNSSGDVSEVQIEGIPTSETNGLYGGSDDTDNSGSLKYVSIRHGGTNIGAGNEINGLTLGGIGSGTTIEHIEIISNQDDAIEFFGGFVNVTHAISWNVGDDGFDTDQAWAGKLEDFYSISPADRLFELDGPEGSMHGSHTIQNGTAICSNSEVTSGDLINVDDNTECTLNNIYFTDIKTGQVINRVTAPLVTFTKIMFNVPVDSLPAHVNGAVPAGVTAGGSSQATMSEFTGWTWADAAGILQ